MNSVRNEVAERGAWSARAQVVTARLAPDRVDPPDPAKIRQAFALLLQIEAGAGLDRVLMQRWLNALKAISWVEECEGGLTITRAGINALRDAAHQRPRLRLAATQPGGGTSAGIGRIDRK